jgi:hypothetical protein
MGEPTITITTTGGNHEAWLTRVVELHHSRMGDAYPVQRDRSFALYQLGWVSGDVEAWVFG